MWKSNPLSLYMNLSHIFAILATFCFQKLPKWQFLLTSKLPKMANEHSSPTAWVIGKLTLNDASCFALLSPCGYFSRLGLCPPPWLSCYISLSLSLSTPDLPGVSLWWLQDTEFHDPRVYLHCNLNTSHAETTAEWSGRNKLHAVHNLPCMSLKYLM